MLAITLALAVGVAAYAAAGACLYLPKPAVFFFYDVARALGSRQAADAAEFMLRALPRVASWVLLLSAAAAALIFLSARSRREASVARPLLYLLVVTDLLVHAWGINPAFDPAYVAEPEWVSRIKATADARFYIGGKYDGSILASDPDAPRAFINPVGLIGSASRGALNTQIRTIRLPGMSGRCSAYDLAVLWPRNFDTATELFRDAGPAARLRFLDRTGVRFRLLAARLADGREPLTRIPYFYNSFLYDWGPGVTPRVMVVPDAVVIEDAGRQVGALFDDWWDNRTTVLVDRPLEASGNPAEPVTPHATIAAEASNHLVVTAGAGPGGNYLVLLDSYADDWQATVDGRPATIARSNGLFRAVRLAPGTHTVAFHYKPRAFSLGAVVTGGALLLTAILLVRPSRRARDDGRRGTGPR